MRLTPLKHSLVVLLSLSILTACKKDELPVAKEDGFGNMSYFAKASGTGVKRMDTKANNTTHTVVVEWSSASVYVEKIAFVGKSNNLLDTTIIVGKNIDIFSSDALAGIFQLPSGSYKDVKVKLFCRKSDRSELAFDFRGAFINTNGGRDYVKVGSSYPFEANLEVPEIIINPSDKYNVAFTFNLDKVLAGISTESLQTARYFVEEDKSKLYVIWKGGSDEEPFYDQVIKNWQTVASVVVTKQ